MKRIPLTQGKYALIDDVDFEEINKYKWYAWQRVGSYYAVRNVRKAEGGRGKEWMHRRIMRAKKGQEIDHRNRNTLDNRHSNLRFCTRSQNMGNTRGWENAASKYKGVFWNKINKNWRAIVGLNYKRISIGSFDTETEAARAYDEKAKELFGEFAYLNFPSGSLLNNETGVT